MRMPSSESERPLVLAPSFSPVPSPPRPNLLLGPLGLRAGWGILLFLMVAFALQNALTVGIALATHTYGEVFSAAPRPNGPSAPALLTLTQATVVEIASASAVLLAGLGLSLLERRRFAVYGLALRRLRDAAPGALCGLIALSVLVGALRTLHLLVFDRRQLHGAAILRSGSAWLAIFVLVGIFEEFLFRGYLQFTLTRGLLGFAERLAPRFARAVAFWSSALLWSLGFFAVHLANRGETAMGLTGVFVAGFVFSYALWRTGSLWWGVGFHMAWDWAQSFLFGVPDSGALSVGRLFVTHPVGSSLWSGGVAGPEGSVLLLPVLLLVVLMIRLHPQGAQPPIEPGPWASLRAPGEPMASHRITGST